MVPSRRTIRTLVAALAFFSFVAPALADQVTPNERVKTRLRAKDQPGPEGNVVGYLKPGENAVLVRTTGAWREVKAGTWTGYVPSGYTTVIPDGPTPAPTATAQPGPATQPTKPKPQAGKTGTCGDGKPLQVHFYNVGQALSALVSLRNLSPGYCGMLLRSSSIPKLEQNWAAVGFQVCVVEKL